MKVPRAIKRAIPHRSRVFPKNSVCQVIILSTLLSSLDSSEICSNVTPLSRPQIDETKMDQRVIESVLNNIMNVSGHLVAEAQTNVEPVEENIEIVSEPIFETINVYEIIERTVGDRYFPKLFQPVRPRLRYSNVLSPSMKRWKLSTKLLLLQ